MNKNRRRNDTLLIFGLLLLTVLCGSMLSLQRTKEAQNDQGDGGNGSGAGYEAVVSLDGKEVLRLRLPEAEQEPAVIQIDEAHVSREAEEDGASAVFSVYKEGAENKEGGVNRLAVRDGQIACIYADCPDQICVKQGYIGSQTETIVCLPHRMIVTLLSVGTD